MVRVVVVVVVVVFFGGGGGRGSGLLEHDCRFLLIASVRVFDIQ